MRFFGWIQGEQLDDYVGRLLTRSLRKLDLATRSQLENFMSDISSALSDLQAAIAAAGARVDADVATLLAKIAELNIDAGAAEDLAGAVVSIQSTVAGINAGFDPVPDAPVEPPVEPAP